jgi:hypothetical protein
MLPSMLASSKVFFPSGLQTKTLYAHHLSAICAACPTHPVLLDLITQIIFGEEYKSQIPSLCCLLHSCYFAPFGPIYPPEHPTLEHSQSTILHQCQRPSLTPIQDNRQNYSSVYPILYIFG